MWPTTRSFSGTTLHVAVGARERLLEARGHQIDVGLGGGGVDARLEPREDAQAVAAAARRAGASSGSGAHSSDSVAQNGAKAKRGGITPTTV